MQDLESALSYMLHIEVATKPIIQGGEYSALRNFVGMLAQVIVRIVWNASHLFILTLCGSHLHSGQMQRACAI